MQNNILNYCQLKYKKMFLQFSILTNHQRNVLLSISSSHQSMTLHKCKYDWPFLILQSVIYKTKIFATLYIYICMLKNKSYIIHAMAILLVQLYQFFRYPCLFSHNWFARIVCYLHQLVEHDSKLLTHPDRNNSRNYRH